MSKATRFLAFAALLFSVMAASPASAQCNGVFGAGQVCGSVAGGPPSPINLPSSTLDAICSTNNDLMIRLSGTWQCSVYTGNFNQSSAYPANITSGHALAILDADVQFGNAYSQHPLGSISTDPLIVGKSNSSISSHVNGQLFTIVFTSSGLIGSPITITYTAGAAETNDTVAAGLCALVNANTTLHSASTGMPIFCFAQGSGGLFNLQYSAAFSATGATPLTTATTGSTGTITLTAETATLDYPVMQLGHSVAGRAAVTGDAIYGLDFTGQDSTGTFNTHYAQITVSVSSPTAGSTHGRTTFLNGGALAPELYVDRGVTLYDSTGAAAANSPVGLGTINAPLTGGYYIGGGAVATQSGLFAQGANVFGGTAANATLNLQATNNVSPSGDKVQIKAGGNVGLTWNGTTLAAAGPFTNTSSILSSSPSAGVGYTSGAGCSVTQITSRTTGVSCTGTTGAITLSNAAGSATPALFTVTNTSVAATDTIQMSEKSGSNLYETFITAVNAGSFNVTFFTTGGTATDSPVFNFTVIKGSAN